MEDLWEALLRRVGNAVDTALKNVSDADAYLGVKECLLSFTMTLEVSPPNPLRMLCAYTKRQQYSYSTENLHAFILYLFGRYVSILEYKFGLRFEKVVKYAMPSTHANVSEQIVLQDDCLPMYVENTTERDSVLDTVWLTKEEREQLVKWIVSLCVMP